ncbi:RDD family protein [Flavobacterium rakeshii]|uniref:RDD family protein n=1 Tax=Flavobacterium rakeshii TaxID=1038845 RepID=UPI002E7AF525|nr:RDD family protein [Flavobacterium rakeshii]
MYTIDTIDVTHEMIAGKGKRFGNYIIDILLRYVVFLGLGVFAGLLYNFGYDSLYLRVIEMSKLEELAYGYLFLFVYYVVFESISQRTLGKYITGTMVVMEDGSKPSFKVILLRSLCRMIPFDPFSFLSDKPRGWHDSLVNTYVVDVKVYKAALELRNSFEEIGSNQ